MHTPYVHSAVRDHVLKFVHYSLKTSEIHGFDVKL